MLMTFGLRKRTRVGFWNVKTMLETSKLAQITKEMENYRIDVLGLSETRWNGVGEHVTAGEELLIYSGKPQGERHEGGVGILFSKNARKSLLEWNAINDRIVIARLQTQLRKLTLVQYYAPTEQAPTEEKEAFYEKLNENLNKIKQSDIKIIMGDLNAKVGTDNTNLEHVMGKHGMGRRNENGELFIELCSNHGLIIGGTIYPHKDIHKVTWKSPDQ